MAERPIIFSAESVRAILEGRKTQTRRVIVPQPDEFIDPKFSGDPFDGLQIVDIGKPWKNGNPIPCPYGLPGDRLWVREPWNARFLDYKFYHQYLPGDRKDTQPGDWGVFYQADDLNTNDRWDSFFRETVTVPRWLTFTPRWASRINLELLSLHVEQVQDITPADCKAEGIYIPEPEAPSVDEALQHLAAYKTAYAEMWNKLNARRGYGWDQNPWVWVLEFPRYGES